MTRLLTVLLGVALLAGCATIPADTQPKVVLDEPVQAPAPIRGPQLDLDPFTLVQEFLNNADNVEAAKTYLTEEARKTWPGDKAPVIIENNPSYPPDLGEEQPPADGGQNNSIAITLTTKHVGNLTSDGTFFPSVQPGEYRLIVQRQADRQWRISQPPPGLLLTKLRFEAAYRRVDLQFFDPAQRIMVPDPRWVERQPRESLEGRVMDLLLAGPSDSLQGAVVSPLAGVKRRTNVVQENDGATLIDLANVEGKSPADRERMVAQIVKSLGGVTLNKLRILDNGSALIPERQDWRTGDLPIYDVLANPGSDLFGLAVEGDRVISLLPDGNPVEGPAGAGAYDLVSAAQSLDGSHLAVVDRVAGGARMRIGPIDQELQAVPLPKATSLTRPTWTPGNERGEAGAEVWTVVNETLVVRAVRAAGGWRVLPVDAADLTRDNGRITELRLSRDGVRLAAVVNGVVQVASIRRTPDSVTIQSPRTLLGDTVRSVVSLDWSERTVLVVATDLPARPVISMPVDGFDGTPYLATNLTLPVTAVTAAPSRPVIVTDAAGMWSTNEPGKVWLALQNGTANSLPFYPG